MSASLARLLQSGGGAAPSAPAAKPLPVPPSADGDARFNTAQLVDALAPAESRVLGAVAAEYGTDFYGSTVLPSHAYHDAWSMPSGVVYSLAGAASVAGARADALPSRIGDGIALVELRSRTDAPLSDEYFLQRRDALAALRVDAEMQEAAAQRRDTTPDLVETDLDAPERLSATLHGGADRIGVYAGYRNDRVAYYLVVRAGAGAAASQLVERARAGKYATLSQLVASSDYRNLVDIASRRRRALLAHVAGLLDVDVAGARTEDALSKLPLAVPAKEQLTHQLVERTGLASKHVTVYANAYNTSDAADGLVLGMSPQRGYVWLSGAPSAARPTGAAWTNAAHNAFPVGTGRCAAYHSRAPPASLQDTRWISERVLSGGAPSERTAANVYRERNAAWMRAEAALGRAYEWGEMALRPVFQRVAASHRAAHVY